MSLIKIAIIVPVCSKGQNLSSDITETYFFKYLYKSLHETKTDGYHYTFFVGYDDNDIYYQNNKDQMLKYEDIRLIELQGCNHAPAFAWNKLFKEAYDSGYDYFFQTADDAVIHHKNWTERFIKQLEEWNGCGVVGPCDPSNHIPRKLSGSRLILEISFVSRIHYELFHTYYYPTIKNWFCDDWISAIYQQNNRCRIFENIVYQNKTRDGRYNIERVSNLNEYIKYGSDVIQKFLDK